MKKEYRLQHEQEFYKKITPFFSVEDAKNPNKLAVGDFIILRNAYDIVIGPFKILGFTKDGSKMYLDWDCYWYPVSLDRFIRKVYEDYESPNLYKPYCSSIEY